MKNIFLFLMMCILSVITVSAADIYVRFKNDISVPKTVNGQKKVTSKSLPVSRKLLDKYSVAPQARSMSFMRSDVLDRTFKISVPDGTDVNLFMEELLGDSRVEMVERVPENRILMVPNDPFYNTISNYDLRWHLNYINAERAWDSASGNPNIIVAVVDNAIYAPHEDLYIPDSLQYDMVKDTVGLSYPLGIDPNSDLCETLSHGTHCAGSIAAINNNGIGIASLSSGVTLMGCGGWSLDKPDVVVSSYDGVIWAAEHGARVISCSWGSDNSDNTSQRIMRTCRENGIIIVAAAGNDGVTKMHYPAGYADVISVASIDSDHSLSYFSNRGKWVTVAAPGGYNKKIGSWFSIFSTVFHYSTLGMAPSSPFYQQRYDRMNGTSMACPIVASLVALMLSKDSTLTFDQVVTILQNSAQDKEYGLNINRLSGTIDAAAAINVVIASRGKRGNAVRSLSAERIFFDSVRVQWAASEDGLAIKGYRIYCNDILLDSCYADTVLYDRITESGTKSYIVFPVYQDEEILQVRSSVNVDIPAFYRLSLSSSVGGSAVPLSAGFPRYKEDQIVVVQAIPDTGYVFVEWGGTNELSRFNEYFAITMTENISLHATFAPDSASAIEEINFSGSDGLKIFPNPVKDILTVDCRYCYEKLIKIDVLDLTGRKIFTELNSKTVNVSSLKNGIYFLRITSSPAASGSVSHDVKTIKFIKSSD